MSTKRKRLIIIGAAAVVVIAALVLFFTLKGGKEEDKVFVQSVAEMSAKPSFANRFGGMVETQSTENIEFNTNYSLKEVFVKEGQKVRRGDKLFSYDTTVVSLQIEQLELDIERLRSNIASTNEQIAQLSNDIQYVSGAERLEYSAQIQQFQAQNAQSEYDIKTKESEIKSKQKSIEDATVVAGIAGTVQTVNDIDAILNGSSYNMDGSPNNTYIVLLASGDLRVKGTVAEQNVYELYQGAQVIVRSRIDENKTWSGVISQVNTDQPEENDEYYYDGYGESSKYAFYVDLDQTDDLILGQHVTIEMDYGQASPASGITLSAGYLVEEDGKFFVWATTKAGGRLKKRFVTTGQYNAELDTYQITDGLEESDYIAWPDESCRPNAKTTTQYLIPEENFEDEMGDMPIDFKADGGDPVPADVMPGGGEDILPDGDIPTDDGVILE